HQRPCHSTARALILLLHRRNDRIAEDRMSRARLRGIRRGGDWVDFGASRPAHVLLRASAIPRQRAARYWAVAVDARRPCRSRYAARLPWIRCTPALLANRGEIQDQLLFRRADRLRISATATNRQL